MKKLDLSVRTTPDEDYGQTALNDYALSAYLLIKSSSKVTAIIDS